MLHIEQLSGGAVTCETQFQWTSAARSDVGLVRKKNEDACLNQAARGLWAVADGMGGHALGDVASRMVVEALDRMPAFDALGAMLAAAQDQLQFANRQLRMEAAMRRMPIIGSTVAALLACGGSCAYLWAGDSRIYLYRNAVLTQLTRDHSQLAQLRLQDDFDADEAILLPSRSMITRAVGAADTLDIDAKTMTVEDGDMFLLCSDGLSNAVSEPEMRGELAVGNCRQVVESLVDIALKRGGRDNISVIVVRAEDLFGSDRTVVNPAL